MTVKPRDLFPEPERRSPTRQVPLAEDLANPEIDVRAMRSFGQRPQAGPETGVPISRFMAEFRWDVAK